MTFQEAVSLNILVIFLATSWAFLGWCGLYELERDHWERYHKKQYPEFSKYLEEKGEFEFILGGFFVFGVGMFALISSLTRWARRQK